jgi:hypothetical protein
MRTWLLRLIGDWSTPCFLCHGYIRMVRLPTLLFGVFWVNMQFSIETNEESWSGLGCP